jgi:hypothetical protein
MRFGVACLLLLALCRSAYADDDPVQAALDCKVGDKALSPEKANTIAGHIQCTLVLDGWSLEGLIADAWIDDGERQQATAIPGGDDADDVMRWDPFVRGEDFHACKDFTIHAQLLQGKDAVWSTDLPVKTKCKKPKKVSAKLSCAFAGADGTVYAWPGNGAKKKPRLDDTFGCTIVGPKKGGDGLTATIAGHAEPMWQDDDTNLYSSVQVLDPGADFQTCDPFTVVASIANLDGQVVWAGKQAIAQKCE